jgi:hypothetical protein
VDFLAPRPHKRIDLRRSQRVLLTMPIVVLGSRADGQPFKEETNTCVVNAHGALVLLSESIGCGGLVIIRNVHSGEERPCAITDVGAKEKGEIKVGIKFLEPSPRFWGVAFPPEDWSPRRESKP